MNSKKIITTCIILLAVVFLFFSLTLRNEFIQNDKALRDLAKEKVNVIQDCYNRGALLDIYNKGTDDFKKITTEDDFISLMNRKKEVLGDFVKSELLTSNVINSNIVTLKYRTTYTNYSLIEEFKFIRKNKDDDLLLGTYFIDDGGKQGEVIRQ